MECNEQLFFFHVLLSCQSCWLPTEVCSVLMGRMRRMGPWVGGSGSVQCQTWRTEVVVARQPSRITLEVMIYNMCRCDSFDFWVKGRKIMQKNTIKQNHVRVIKIGVPQKINTLSADKQKQQTQKRNTMHLYDMANPLDSSNKKSHIFSSIFSYFFRWET